MFSGIKNIALLLLFIVLITWFFASGLAGKLYGGITLIKNYIGQLVYFFGSSGEGLVISIIAGLLGVLLVVIFINSWKPQ